MPLSIPAEEGSVFTFVASVKAGVGLALNLKVTISEKTASFGGADNGEAC